MKKQRKKRIIVVAAVVVLAVLVGIGIKIYQRTQVKTYTFPENLVDYMGLSVEQQVENINKVDATENICTAVYENEDGSFSVKLNEKQQKWWVKNTGTKISEYEKSVAQNGGKLEVSENRKSVIFEVSPDLSMEYIHSKSFSVSVFAAEYQILTGNTEKWEVYLCFKNIETGEIIADGTLPYDTIEFTDADIK